MSGRVEWTSPRSERAAVLSAEQLRELSAEIAGQLRLELALPAKAEAVELPMLGELVDEWLRSVRARHAQPAQDEYQARWLRELYLETEATLTVAMVRAQLERVARETSPCTANKVRSAGAQAVAEAAAAGRWGAANPFALVKRAKEPRRAYHLLLDAAELEAVQEQLRPDRRRQFRLTLHLGLRTGELFALRKDDVDLQRQVLHVRRSHERDSTKTGEPRALPIVAAIAGDLLEAMALVPDGGLLFPSESGGLQRRDTKMSTVLRAAMRAANVQVTAVVHKCRRAGCGQQLVDGPQAPPRDCPECGFRMQAVPSVTPVRWYNLRHSAATLHRQAGADPLAISLMLGHRRRGASTTENVYTHVDMAWLRAQLSRWKLRG